MIKHTRQWLSDLENPVALSSANAVDRARKEQLEREAERRDRDR